MTARYLLCPGYVISRTDGDRHFISSLQLAFLYGVPKNQCIVLPPSEQGALGGGRRRTELLYLADRGDLIALHPRYDGNYTIPQK